MNIRGTMATEKRAYMTKSAMELQQIAVANSGDVKIIEKIKHELTFRHTAAAKKLLDELGKGGPISLTPQSKPRVAVDISASVHKDCEMLEVSYELLRSTFSEQGELLARWGLTESMPIDLLEKIGTMWIEKLTSGYGHAIRTLEQLGKDFKQLEIPVPGLKKNA